MVVTLLILTFVYILISWLTLFGFGFRDENNRGWMWLQAVVLPPLLFCRRLIPWARIGMLDLSPLLYFFALSILHLLLKTWYWMAVLMMKDALALSIMYS